MTLPPAPLHFVTIIFLHYTTLNIDIGIILIIDSIGELVTSNEQERKDKKEILKYINMFDDILRRDNEIIHITSSGFVINKDKVLLVHHNIFNAWSLLGKHTDGEGNLLGAAVLEVKE